MAMAYEPLHHKYRPQTFAQLVGQDAIATTLSNALRQQRIAPAYLFSGPRGTGKTSSARILAKSLNCIRANVPTDQPCGLCEVCRAIANGSALDVIEIDAASNTGVDNIRELIERSQFAPVQCRYKVYVIDECHMLSTAAFNALLKTLEEPPPRVVFVLATTDPQRVLPTIISRCQRFDYRRIPLEAMVVHLQQIADKEGIEISEDAVRLVAQVSQGGLRDAESLLDQLSLLEGQVTIERVWDLVGAVPERDLLALVRAIATNDAVLVLDQARHLMDRGREPIILLQNLASFYRDLLIAKTAPDRNDLVTITPSTWEDLCDFVQGLDIPLILAGQQHLRAAEVQVKNTTQPRLWLEVTLLGLLPSALNVQTADTPVRDAVTVPRSQPQPPSVKSQPDIPAPITSNTNGSAPLAEPPIARSHPPSAAGNGSETAGPAASAEAPPSAEHSVEPTDEEPPDSTALPPEPEPMLDQATAAESAVSASLSEIWQRVIAHLQPPATQALVRQQCRLLAYDGSEARLGVSTRPLFRLAQSRLPNVEAAFEQVFQRKVRVLLEVTNPDAGAIAPEAPHPPSASTATPSSPSPPPYRPEPILDQSGNGASAPPSLPPHSSQPIKPDGTEPPEPRLSYLGEDEFSRSTQRFAQFFNGQVIDLESNTVISSEPLSSPSVNGDRAQTAANSELMDSLDAEEDDDEMPF